MDTSQSLWTLAWLVDIIKNLIFRNINFFSLSYMLSSSQHHHLLRPGHHQYRRHSGYMLPVLQPSPFCKYSSKRKDQAQTNNIGGCRCHMRMSASPQSGSLKSTRSLSHNQISPRFLCIITWSSQYLSQDSLKTRKQELTKHFGSFRNQDLRSQWFKRTDAIYSHLYLCNDW